jgi:small-conductance mechanosensitive channel
MKIIPEIVEKIIRDIELAEFDRSHFVSFGNSALNFETSYYVLSSEFIDYRNVHQKVLLEIKNNFKEEGIEMAFPTRTIHLSKNN